MRNSITLSLVGSDLEALEAIKLKGESLSDENVQVEKADIEIDNGFAITVATVSMVISFVSGVGSKVLASWIYDKLKGKPPKPVFEIYIDGVKADTKEDLTTLVKEKTNEE